jgi:hypothetical protein
LNPGVERDGRGALLEGSSILPIGKIRMISPFCKISTAILIELRGRVRAI